MRIVLDTNVLVSAFISPHGPPAQVVRMVLQGDVAALHDARILAEYREVLARPKFGFEPEEIEEVVGQIGRAGETVFARPLTVELPDPDGLPFLEVAVAGGAELLVTGNARHYLPVRGQHNVPIASPAELVARIAGRRGHGPG
ncbi:MAG: putative toxin-antitoxin system toxin component, PIN family [Chloroflexota bacterium]|nr:putative toxin-antitoxin system toxin component, PIN family [Chloroflexota bacterium]